MGQSVPLKRSAKIGIFGLKNLDFLVFIAI
jgi:hypothetical protein